MKRIIPLLLIVCLLAGCAKATPDKKETKGTTAPTEAEDVVTEPTTPEPEPPVVLYRHPLTGEPLEEPWTVRPVAVSVPNNKEVYPHHGTGSADILYEIECDGDVTRMLAVFTNLNGIEKLGPVRSARTYLNNLAISYDAPIAHCGGSPGGRTGRYDSADGDTIANWPHIDEMYNGSYFFRDTDRYYYQGYLWEYTLFTSGAGLKGAMDARGYTEDAENPPVIDFGLTFGDASSAAAGETANTVLVEFRGSKSTTFNYKDGVYEVIQHGSVYTDANTDEAITFRNVLALQAEQWYDGAGYRTYYDLIGSGTGYYACDGKIVPIKWERPTLRDAFSYTLEDGTPITLGVGTSYIAVIGQRGAVSYE